MRPIPFIAALLTIVAAWPGIAAARPDRQQESRAARMNAEQRVRARRDVDEAQRRARQADERAAERGREIVRQRESR